MVVHNINWAKEQETGVPILDEQHKILYKAVAVLEDLVRGKATRSAIERGLNELQSSIKVHFDSEEKLLSSFDGPELRASASVTHARLAEDIAKLISDYHSKAQVLDAKSLSSLKNWLARHVAEDKGLASFLKSTNSVVQMVNRSF